MFNHVSAHPRSAHRPEPTAKVTSAGMMTELLSGKKKSVLDSTVRAD